MKKKFSDILELEDFIKKNNIKLQFDQDLSYLTKALFICGKQIPNRLAIQPMEGFDASENGLPGKLTSRRYIRYARGGAGLIWFEATAISPDGRTNDHQLMINQNTLADFKELLKKIRKEAKNGFGSSHQPFLVLQLTHSGRFSKYNHTRKPVIAVHDLLYDQAVNIDENYPIVDDYQLEQLQEKYIDSAKWAFRAGFDAIDIKSCHRYLINELLGARDREGKFGGSYENRTRLIKEILMEIKRMVPELILGVRMNASDMLSSKNSWGVDLSKNEEQHFDLSETKKLTKELVQLGVEIINVTAGTPYLNPHVTRPFNIPVINGWEQPEHPLKGVERLILFAKEIQKNIPSIPVMGSGYTWLGEFAPMVASANIKEKNQSIAGFGRQAFAYPDFVKDILTKGKMDPSKCCITCSQCSQLMIYGISTGCVIRDKDIYGPIFQNAKKTYK
jgi:2,4-dienoyl-CoA reductase (NADPH2)